MVHFPRLDQTSYQVVGDQLTPKSSWETFIQGVFPLLRSKEDEKVASFFQKHIGDIQQGRSTFSTSQREELYQSALSFVSRWKVSDKVPSSVRKLEHALFAAKQVPLSGLEKVEASGLKERIQAHAGTELKRWTDKYHLPEEIYYSCPDFVRFLFDAHLHRNLEVYGHKLFVTPGQPWLKVEGVLRPWSYIRSRFHLEEGKIYTIEDGVKKRWTYLENGLVQHDPTKWTEPKPFKTLEKPPGEYQFQIVTSHVEPSQHQFYDHVLKGARHSWFRLITPEGKVYSFGGRIQAKDFNVLQPMAGVKGFVECPDVYEFCPEHQLVTTIPISEKAAHNVLKTVKDQQEAEVFNYVDTNCCSFTRKMLQAAGLDDIPCERHIVDNLYKFLVPKVIRKLIKFVMRYTFGLIMPTCIVNFLMKFKNALGTLVFSPLFSLLGAWRGAPIRFEERDGEVLGFLQRVVDRHGLNTIVAKGSRGSLFRSVWDVFDPGRMMVSMPVLLAKWQRKQGERTRYY